MSGDPYTLLYLVLLAMVLCFILFRILPDEVRRARMRRALLAAPVTRTLDEAEYKALDYLRSDGRLGTDREVRCIEGDVQHRRIGGFLYGVICHYIGGTHVILPYDAMQHVGDYNRAEVVLGRRVMFADPVVVVVRLGAFHIAEGLRREQHQQAAEAAWQAGQDPSPCATGDDVDAGRHGTSSEAHGAHHARPHSRVLPDDAVILAQRRESTEELDLCRAPWLGLVPAACWLLACGLFWFATWERPADAVTWSASAAAAIVAGAGVVLMRRRVRREEVPGEVNRVRGVLNGKAFHFAGQPMFGPPFLLGRQQTVELPDHWHCLGTLPIGPAVDAQVRTIDRHVLSLGPAWSLVDEARRFPPVHYAHHLIWLIVAAVALAGALVTGNAVDTDLSLAAHTFEGQGYRQETSVDALIARPPRVGDWLRIQGEAHCMPGVDNINGTSRLGVRCDELRWGGAAMALPRLSLPDSIATLASSPYLPPVQAFLPSRADHAPAPDPMTTKALRRVVDHIEQACRDGLSNCPALRQDLVSHLARQAEREGVEGSHIITALDWYGLSMRLHEYVKDGGSDRLLANASTRRINALLYRYLDDHVARWLADITPAISRVQFNSIRLRGLGTQYVYARPPAPSALADTQAHWRHIVEQLTVAKPFTMQGSVVGIEQDAEGLHLTLDADAAGNQSSAALIQSLWRGLALLLLLVQAAMLVYCLYSEVKRRQAIAADVALRLPPWADQPVSRLPTCVAFRKLT